MSDNFILAKNTLWDFLKNPVKDILVITTLKEKRKLFIPLFLLEILIAFFCAIIITILIKYDLTKSVNHEVVHLFNKDPHWNVFIMTVVIAPIIEELMFRLHLRLNEKKIYINLIILLSSIILILSSFVRVKFVQISILALGIIFLSIYYFNRTKFNQFLLTVWNRNFAYIFYVSAFGFGILHINNFHPSIITYLLIPILILPQLLLGIFCGYIRLRLGFIWGCSFHSFHNLIFIIPILMTPLIPFSNKYSIMIVEKDSSNITNTWRMKNDTIEFDRYKIKEIVPRLTMVDNECIEYEDQSIADKILTINFSRDAKKPLARTRNAAYLVLTEILRKYNLKIEQKQIEREVYQLQVVDPVKLYLYKQYRNDTLTTGNISALYKKFHTFKNIDLHTIAFLISRNYDKIVIDSSKNRNKYTIRIPELEFDELNKFMEDQYGIKLNKGMSKMFGYKVSSDR